MAGASTRITFIAIAVGLLMCAGCSKTPPPDPMEGTTRGEVVGGYVVHPTKSQELQEKQQREIAHQQEEDLDRQQREIEDLKRQQYQDERLKNYLDRTQAASKGRDITPPAAGPSATPTPKY